jgi:hypothetical protein
MGFGRSAGICGQALGRTSFPLRLTLKIFQGGIQIRMPPCSQFIHVCAILLQIFSLSAIFTLILLQRKDFMEVARFTEYKKRVIDNCSKVIVGKDDAISLVLTCFILCRTADVCSQKNTQFPGSVERVPKIPGIVFMKKHLNPIA